jgi:8-amino-7-oxononanoate synthase
MQVPFGSSGSRLTTGTHLEHKELEDCISNWKACEDTIVFSSGYLANLGALSALIDKEDVVFIDELAHSCMWDALRINNVRKYIFAHNDSQELKTLIQKYRHQYTNSFIITESVFSMDGDLAKVTELLKLADQYDALILVDDAHGFGVLGQHGFGILEHTGIQNASEASARIIYIGTLGKAAGISGAFIAGHKTLIEWIMQKGRPYIYTTASPPAIAHGLLKSLELMSDDSYRASLNKNIQYWKKTLRLKKWVLMPSDTAIQPIMIGKTENALRVAQQLYQKNIWVPAIRPPTVPTDTARLRITFSASHSAEQIDQLIQALMEIEHGH